MLRVLIPERKSFCAILGLWLVLLPLYGLWLWRDQVSAPWDMSGHAKDALDVWADLVHGHLGHIYRISNYYPPLFHILAAPCSLISTHPDVYCLANWLVLLALMLAVWLTGRELSGDAAGLGAALIVPAYGYITWMCRMPMLDLTLTATVAWTLWLLVRDKPLAARGQAHALGILIGLGLLAKWPYVFFTTLPIAFYLWRFLRDAVKSPGGLRSRNVWLPLGWLAFWPLLLAGPWYVRAIPVILGKIPKQLGGEVARIEGDPSVFSVDSLTAYARQLEQFYFRLPLLILFVAGLALLFRLSQKRSLDRHAVYGWSVLGLSLVSGYVFLTLIANKDPRYIMPLVPVLAVASTHWIGRLVPRARTLAIALLGLLSLGMVSWNLFVFARPNPCDMKIETVAQWIVDQKLQDKKAAAVLVVPNDWQLNAAALNFALYRRDCHFFARMTNKPLNRKMLKEFEYVLLIDPPAADTGVAPCVRRNTAYFRPQKEWRICKTFTRGDGKTLQLLRRAPSPR